MIKCTPKLMLSHGSLRKIRRSEIILISLSLKGLSYFTSKLDKRSGT